MSLLAMDFIVYVKIFSPKVMALDSVK